MVTSARIDHSSLAEWTTRGTFERPSESFGSLASHRGPRTTRLTMPVFEDVSNNNRGGRGGISAYRDYSYPAESTTRVRISRGRLGAEETMDVPSGMRILLGTRPRNECSVVLVTYGRTVTMIVNNKYENSISVMRSLPRSIILGIRRFGSVSRPRSCPWTCWRHRVRFIERENTFHGRK